VIEGRVNTGLGAKVDGKIRGSVIIPARNEQSHIVFCIESIKNQSKTPFEIIVVDNGSSDATVKISEDLGCRVVHEERKGISYARNKGAQEAGGNVLYFVDADGVLSKNWIGQASEILGKRSDVGVVVGLNVFAHEKLLKRLWYNTYTLSVYTGLVLSNLLLKKPYLAGNNMAIRKDVFWQLNGFENLAAEDMWMSRKLWQEKNIKTVFNPKMLIHYSSRGFDKAGYIKTIAFWVKASLIKIPQDNYNFRNKNIDQKSKSA